MLVNDFIRQYAQETDRDSYGYPVYIVPIAAIMGTINSCDSSRGYDVTDPYTLQESWADLFTEKRADDHYPSLVDSIREHGFLTPLCITTHFGELKYFHNGNHRLAAAVEVGHPNVPIVFIEEDDYQDRWTATTLEGSDGDEWEYYEDTRNGFIQAAGPPIIPPLG